MMMKQDWTAQDLSRRDLLRRGAVFGAAALIAGSALVHAPEVEAGEVQPVAIDNCELGSQELCDLRNAADAARDYAEENPGVGILIHVGQDIPNRHFQTADQFGQALVQAFAKHGVEARYFWRQNDAPATGLSFYIGHLIHGQHNGTELKNVQQAVQAIPEVAVQTKELNGIAAVAPDTPDSRPSGG